MSTLHSTGWRRVLLIAPALALGGVILVLPLLILLSGALAEGISAYVSAIDAPAARAALRLTLTVAANYGGRWDILQANAAARAVNRAMLGGRVSLSIGLVALGVDDELAHSSLRFGIGRFTTEEEVDFVLSLLEQHVQRLREMSPLWEMVQEGIDLKEIQWTQDAHHH